MTALKLTTTLVLSLLAGSALAENHGMDITGDAAKGEKVFRKCKACHQVGPEAENKVGPTLNGILGRAIGTGADFAYSDAFVAMGADGKVWDIESLTAFLTKPKDFNKKTKMAFAGLRKDADRENVIAYLATFNADGSPAE